MAKLKVLLDEFKVFVLRGNILDLAVAVVIATAFGLVIKSFTEGILLAFVAAVFGKPSFDAVTIGIGDGELLVGAFLTEVLNFLIVAAALFAILKVAAAMRRAPEEAAAAPAPSDEVVLLGQIRDLLADGSRRR